MLPDSCDSEGLASVDDPTHIVVSDDDIIVRQLTWLQRLKFLVGEGEGSVGLQCVKYTPAGIVRAETLRPPPHNLDKILLGGPLDGVPIVRVRRGRYTPFN
jgi:hypothetical protein